MDGLWPDCLSRTAKPSPRFIQFTAMEFDQPVAGELFSIRSKLTQGQKAIHKPKLYQTSLPDSDTTPPEMQD